VAFAVLAPERGGGDRANERGCGDYLESLAREIRRQAESGCESLCIDRLLGRAPWGRRQTERLFRDRYLTSPARYFRDCQWERAEALLRGGKDVLSASLEAGFASPGRLHDAVVARRGMTPGEVRRGGAGVRVAYGFFDTQLGTVLIAATARGMCALRLCNVQREDGDTSLALVRADFPRAEFVEDAAAVQPYADQLVAFLEARAENFTPRLDILRGTTFQREVWAELQRLQPGELVSYADIAERLGRPQAARAVAGACAANHLAIAIPCHRVLRSDGSIAGFRWGGEWRQRLLKLEAEMTAAGTDS
jgi:AraC family transcriptional regulator of adaptative response/methylated-DNA-[protein]-cysteine methyltransferase